MNYNDLFIEQKLTNPLSKEETYYYFEKYKSKDMKAREIIINHNIKLVLYRVTKRFINFPYDKKELIQIGLVGLIKAVDTFDISKSIQFSSYASKCIDNEILMFVRKGNKYINDESLDRTIETGIEGNSVKIGDNIKDETCNIEINYEEKEEQLIIDKIIMSLPERDKEIIMLHFGFIDNKIFTQKEIATKLNISQPQVSRLLSKILERISIELTKEEIIPISKTLKKTSKH